MAGDKGTSGECPEKLSSISFHSDIVPELGCTDFIKSAKEVNVFVTGCGQQLQDQLGVYHDSIGDLFLHRCYVRTCRDR